MPDLLAEPDIDKPVDAEIAGCLDLSNPSSFFLYAGAGSGKTRSLVEALGYTLGKSRRQLLVHRQSIAVITYTNAAANEISGRLEFDPLVSVSTIHSFCWKLIGEFQEDIREWLRRELAIELTELESKRSRAGTKAEDDRVYRIARNEKRLASLDEICRFTYNPVGDNRSRESLSHPQVISIASDFLTGRPRLREILIGRHPILFIDESQDTNGRLLDAMLLLEASHSGAFAMGLFGDTMQRIYGDGKADLPGVIPNTWAKPAKRMNHRSPQRIVELANRIRCDVDEHVQFARKGSQVGTARLFIVGEPVADVSAVESLVAQRMANETGDPGWCDSESKSQEGCKTPEVKRLILEHHMAAARLGFATLYVSLNRLARERTSLRNGSIGGLQPFLREVIPLVEAAERNDEFTVTRIARRASPLLSRESLRQCSESGGGVLEHLARTRSAVAELVGLWSEGKSPKLRDVAQHISSSGLFVLPDEIVRALSASPLGEGETEAEIDEDLTVWQECLEVPFTEVIEYGKYVLGLSPFTTHQDVKGLEFPRVMVIVNDREARGSTFSYEKLFGAKGQSATDTRNLEGGLETSVDRTRRLFYVTCTRAQESLAVVAYTASPHSARQHAIARNWFEESEIEIVDGSGSR